VAREGHAGVAADAAAEEQLLHVGSEHLAAALELLMSSQRGLSYFNWECDPPLLGLALATLARHENRRYAHCPFRLAGGESVRRGV
jgi:hypothetical protein